MGLSQPEIALIRDRVSPEFIHWLCQMIHAAPERRFPAAQEALKALQHPISIATQPQSSQLKLLFDAASLTILTPRAYKLPLRRSNFLATSWLFWAIFGSISIVVLNFFFPFFFRFFRSLIMNWLGQTRLHLSPQGIFYTFEMMGRRWQKAPVGALSQVNAVEYRQTNPPSLVLQTGGIQYVLQQEEGLLITKEELKWLAQELSQWLDIPNVQTG